MNSTPVIPAAEAELEKSIVQAGAAKAPRLTPAEIDACIVSEHYFTAAQGALGFCSNEDWFAGHEGPFGEPGRQAGPLDLLTFCVLVLRNGSR